MIEFQHSRLALLRGHGFRSDMCVSFFQLAQLLNAGITIEQAISELCEQEHSSKVRPIWMDISNRVSAGQEIPEAMLHWRTAFDDTTIALLKSAYANGELSTACESVYEYLQWQLDVRSRMQSVLTYPVFSLIVLFAVLVFLLLTIVPSLSGFILSADSVVAWHTQVLLSVSGWLQLYLSQSVTFLLVLILVVLLVARSSPIISLLWDSIVLKIPVIGRLVINLSLSRYSRCCAHLYGCGVSLEESLRLAEATVSNKVLRADLATVRLSMIRGVRLGDALRAIQTIPGMFKRMVSIGESSGTLEKTLLHLSRQQAMSTELALKRVEQLMGPGIMLVAGSSLLWVVVSVLGPVYSAAISVVLNS